MKRKEALNTIMNSISKYDAVISTMGLISRELYEEHDSPQIFYMTGSMGLAPSMGLGVSLNKPTRRVVVIDGDGGLLMNLGAMATIGHHSPKNLVHIVLDNRAYASCSEEPTISYTTKLDEIAKVVGYSNIYNVDSEEKLQEAIKESSYKNGATFILANIELGGRKDFARPLDLETVKKRFKRFLSETDESEVT